MGVLLGGTVTVAFGILSVAVDRYLATGALIGLGVMGLSFGMVIGEWTILSADIADRLREVNNNTR